MRSNIVIVLLLLLVSIPAVKTLFLPGGFTAHDLTHHVIRQVNMDKLLSEGQFPPRWSGDLNNGYGYPVFLFNYPLPALIGEIFHKAGLGYVDSVKAVLFSSLILSIFGMYLFLRSLLGMRSAAFLGAVFYSYAPLRFSNVYVAAAVGSALALGVLPYVFWSLVEIKKGKRFAPFFGAISLAGLILAHNVTALIFAPVILIFALILGREMRLIKQYGIMFLLGLGLSAWFFLPAILEKQFIRFDEIYSGFYKDQFISFWQLIRSPWGFGLSHPQNPEPGDMSYQLGLAQILVMLIFSVLFWIKKGIKEIKVLGGFIFFFFVLSIFLMLKISLPFWDNLSFLSLVQFPLRFQAISIFTASIAAGLVIKYLPYRKVVFVVLLVLAIYANRNHWNVNEKFDPGENYYLNLKTTTASSNEHLPKWGRAMDKASTGKLEFIQGGGAIKIQKDQSALVLAEVEATTASKLVFNQFYFPGWQIKVDDKLTSFNYLTNGPNYGLPIFDVTAGKHIIKAEFKNTIDRNIADAISFMSVLVLWVGLCRLLIRR